MIPGRRALALGQRLRRRHFHRPAARRRLGRRRQDVPQRPVPEGQARAGLPAAAHAAGVLRRRHRRDQCMDAQDSTARTSTGWHRRTAKRRSRRWRQGKAALGDFNGRQFFEALLQITMEGFFADPIYGGNRNKAGVEDGRLSLVCRRSIPTLIDEYRNKRYVRRNHNRSRISREGGRSWQRD